MRDFPQYTAGGTLTKNSEYAEGHEKTFDGESGAKIANMRKVTKKLSVGIWAKIANMRKVTKYTFGGNLARK